MDIMGIGIRGFVMPIYALIDAVLAYTTNAVIAAFQTAFQQIQQSSAGTSTGLPWYGVFALCFVLMGIMMTLSGYFEDLSDYARTAMFGLGYPGEAIVYAIGAIIGLDLFWKAFSGMTIGGIGSDALFSSVASVVILIVTALYSLLA